MRLHRFFVRNLSVHKKKDGERLGTSEKKEIAEGSIVTCAHDSYQWQRVFRYGQGDQVILFDGSGKDYVCEILEYQGEITLLRVVTICENVVKPARQVILVAALVKRDTFEWIVEKATELGVVEIIPVIAERSEKKSLNIERLEKICIEASEQSGRGDVPVLAQTVSLSELLDTRQEKLRGLKESSMIIFDPSGSPFTGRDVEKDFSVKNSKNSPEKMAVFVGPEGGWSAEELESFKKAGMPIGSLGPQILRAETAVIAALSKFVF